MREPRRLLRTIVTDRRIWGLTVLLAGWPALGTLTRVDLVLETATPVVYGYLFVLSAVVPGFPGDALFWGGLVVFYFAVATVVVGLFDWARTTTAERRKRRTTE